MRVTRNQVRQIVVLIIIVAATVAANLFATSQRDVANDNFAATVFFFPANYVFGTIWPVIYLGIVALAIHQVVPAQGGNPRYQRGMWVLAINLILNGAWVAIFNAQLFVLSFVTIIPILVTAILAYRLLGIARSPEAGKVERIVTIPVSIYSAWLTIATVANVSLVLANADWGAWGLSYQTWGVIMLIVGVGLGALFMFRFRDPVFPAVYVYAYLGIVVRRLGEAQSIVIAASAGAGALLLLFVIGLVTRRSAHV